jgi:hypothetical protein
MALSRDTVVQYAHMHDKLSLFIPLLFLNKHDYIPASKLTAILSLVRSAHITHIPDKFLSTFIRYWDINPKFLELSWLASCATYYYADDILKLRYLEFMTFSDIAQEIHLSSRSVAHYHNVAAKEFLSTYESLSQERIRKYSLTSDDTTCALLSESML